MRTILIFHESDIIDNELTVRWMASFSDLVGLVILRERPSRMRSRISREIKRVGGLRFLDVIAFRIYYKIFLAKHDERELKNIAALRSKEFLRADNIPAIIADTPNSDAVREFIRSCKPDIVIARCKTLLRVDVFSIPTNGTFVLHPGVCPEYRNAHGCFWALANGEYEKVGLTLLKIDEGIDTGPVYGYFSYDFDASAESHVIIQNNVFTENLNALQKKLEAIYEGTATPVNTDARVSRTWGQPWLSAYLRIRNANRSVSSLVSGAKRSRSDKT